MREATGVVATRRFAQLLGYALNLSIGSRPGHVHAPEVDTAPMDEERVARDGVADAVATNVDEADVGDLTKEGPAARGRESW